MGIVGVISAVVSSLVAGRGLKSSTLAHRAKLMETFGRFLSARGFVDADVVTAEEVRAFLDARRVSGGRPTHSERHSRLAAVRLLYREARRLQLASTDPTFDINLPPRAPTSARPVTDEEIVLGRRFAVQNTSTRPAVCWALAEATARTSEIPHLRLSDVDVARGRVFIHGGRTTQERLGHLSGWGEEQIGRRIISIASDEGPDPVLMGEGRWATEDAGRAAATMTLGATLKQAGLLSPGINPRSIPAWAGARALAGGASIDQVATMLGVRSLDQAAAIVGFDWRAGRPE